MPCKALVKEGNDGNHVEVFKEANDGCLIDIKLITGSFRILIKKAIKQGALSLNLFMACLEMVFRGLNCEGGISVDGEWLKYIRFDDDIIPTANGASEKTTCSRSSTQEVRRPKNKMPEKRN